jgi:hypothetical protein
LQLLFPFTGRLLTDYGTRKIASIISHFAGLSQASSYDVKPTCLRKAGLPRRRQRHKAVLKQSDLRLAVGFRGLITDM